MIHPPEVILNSGKIRRDNDLLMTAIHLGAGSVTSQK